MDGGWVGRVYTVPGFPLVNLIILCKSLICLGIKYLWVFFLFLFMLSNLSLNYHKIFYRQQQESTETVYFHIPSQLGMEITHSLLLEWLPLKWGCGWVAMQPCTAGLPCSCYLSIIHINSWVAMQLLLNHHSYKHLLLKHHAYKQCSCYYSIIHINDAAVTKASCI